MTKKSEEQVRRERRLALEMQVCSSKSFFEIAASQLATEDRIRRIFKMIRPHIKDRSRGFVFKVVMIYITNAYRKGMRDCEQGRWIMPRLSSYEHESAVSTKLPHRPKRQKRHRAGKDA